MNKETMITAPDTWEPTSDQCEWMREQLAAEYPHLSVSVTMRDGALHVEAVPA